MATSAPVLDRVRFNSDLDVLGLTGFSRLTLQSADVMWRIVRVGVWLQLFPITVPIYGIQLPNALRVGHRGPIRHALSRALVRSRGRKAQVVSSASELEGLRDGTSVAAEGVVRATSFVPNLPDVLFRRVDFQVENISFTTERLHLVYETAVNFVLGDDLHIETAQGLFFAPRGKAWRMKWTPPSSHLELPLPPDIRLRSLVKQSSMRKRHTCSVLRQGDRVVIYGVKGRLLDPNVSRLARQSPLRPSIGGDGLHPLVIFGKQLGQRDSDSSE